jgi:hypothetical protein
MLDHTGFAVSNLKKSGLEGGGKDNGKPGVRPHFRLRPRRQQHRSRMS